MNELREWLIEELKWENQQAEQHGSAWAENGRTYHYEIMLTSRARASALARTIDKIDGRL
jgi:hypothetical protein